MTEQEPHTPQAPRPAADEKSAVARCECLVRDPCGCFVDPCACFRADERGCYTDCGCPDRTSVDLHTLL